MLVAYAMTSILILWVVIGLLTVLLLVRLMLVLVPRTWLYESLPAIHHGVLTLLVALIEHRIRIVRRGLGYRRTGRRGSIIGVAASTTIHGGAGSSQMTGMVILLIVLAIVEGSSSREPVRSICHLTGSRGGKTTDFTLYQVRQRRG